MTAFDDVVQPNVVLASQRLFPCQEHCNDRRRHDVVISILFNCSFSHFCVMSSSSQCLYNVFTVCIHLLIHSLFQVNEFGKK